MGTDMDSCTLTDTTLSRTIATVARAAVEAHARNDQHS